MPATYSPQSFLRQCPNALLQEYFSRHNCLSEIDFSALKETEIDSVFLALTQLPEPERRRIETDFQNIRALATATGIQTLFKALQWHNLNLPDFGKKRGYHDKSLWVFLHHRQIFDDVLRFTMPHTQAGYWRIFSLPKTGLFDGSKTACDALASTISGYFQTQQGRGEFCTAERHTYDGKEFLFVYPSNYHQEVVEYDNRRLSRRTIHPAFEVAFVLFPDENRADVYHEGSQKEAWQLFKHYARHMMALEDIGEKPKQAYDLKNLAIIVHEQRILA